MLGGRTTDEDPVTPVCLLNPQVREVIGELELVSSAIRVDHRAVGGIELTLGRNVR